MPLADVRPGMRCTGLSVIRGTAITAFDVEVIDVIAEDPAVGGARILIRVSGPAVDATGVGPGFSGSPILCGGRNAGAISEGIGEYGNKVVLATPIEDILSARPKPAPAAARRAPRLLRSAHPLVGPLTARGLSPGARRLLTRAARRAGRSVLAAPQGPQAGYPAQDLRPGSALAASISAGDVSIGAVGTVAYRDGNAIYAFGHSLDALGRRSLFMQDAYVFSIIGNPVGVPDLGAQTYKLTSSGGHVLGAITNDTLSAISGTLGKGPASIPLRVTAPRRGRRTRCARVAARRRALPGLRRGPLLRGAAGHSERARPAARRFRAGDPEVVHALPGEPAAAADGLLQQLLRRVRGAVGGRRGRLARGGLRSGPARHPRRRCEHGGQARGGRRRDRRRRRRRARSCRRADARAGGHTPARRGARARSAFACRFRATCARGGARS